MKLLSNEMAAADEFWNRVPGAEEAKGIIKKLNREFKKKNTSAASLADEPIESVSRYITRELVERDVIDIEEDATMLLKIEKILEEQSKGFKILYPDVTGWEDEDLEQWIEGSVMPLKNEVFDSIKDEVMMKVKSEDLSKENSKLKMEIGHIFDSLAAINGLRMGFPSLIGLSRDGKYTSEGAEEDHLEAMLEANTFLQDFFKYQGGWLFFRKIKFSKRQRETLEIGEGAPEEINEVLRDLYFENNFIKITNVIELTDTFMIRGWTKYEMDDHLFYYDKKQKNLYLRPSKESPYIAVIQKTGESGNSFNLKTLHLPASLPSDEQWQAMEKTLGFLQKTAGEISEVFENQGINSSLERLKEWYQEAVPSPEWKVQNMAGKKAIKLLKDLRQQIEFLESEEFLEGYRQIQSIIKKEDADEDIVMLESGQWKGGKFEEGQKSLIVIPYEAYFFDNLVESLDTAEDSHRDFEDTIWHFDEGIRRFEQYQRLLNYIAAPETIPEGFTVNTESWDFPKKIYKRFLLPYKEEAKRRAAASSLVVSRETKDEGREMEEASSPVFLEDSGEREALSAKRAMDSGRQVPSDFTKGGIDFNPELLDLQIKRDGHGVPLPLEFQPVENMNIEGIFPVIINIMPVTVPMLLGLVGEASSEPLAGTGQGIPRDLAIREKDGEFFDGPQLSMLN